MEKGLEMEISLAKLREVIMLCLKGRENVT